MNVGCSEDVKNDEDEDDIYKDIGDFHFDKELTKLEESNKAYLEDIARLSEKLKVLTERNKELEKVNDILATNISILMKTAKAEIERKQKVIDELRQKSEGYGRHWGQSMYLQNSGTCTNCGSVQNKTGFNRNNSNFKNDTEVGEIKNSDEINSEEDRRKFGDCKKDYCNDTGKNGSHEKSRGRSREKHSNKHSRKSSRRSSSNSRHSGSKKRRGYSSDRRRRSDRDERCRKRDRSRSERHTNSHRGDHSPHRKESQRKCRDRQRSHREKSSSRWKDHSSDRRRGESESIEKKEVNAEVPETKPVKTEAAKDQVKEKFDVVKKINIDEYHQKKSNSGAGHRKDNDLFPRQSVLSDLYVEPVTSDRLTGPESNEVRSGNQVEEELGGSDEEIGVWPGRRTQRKSENVKPRTLYSKRMEAKLQQQLLEEALKFAESEKENQRKAEVEKAEEVKEVAEKASEVVESEKEEGEITFDEEDKTLVEEKETVERQPEPPLIEGVSQKDEEPQDAISDDRIKEFTPLKNNYKLSEISPLKPLPKQHILEYYNLKPSGQKLTNIEPEILDFSQTLPETPGKNFMLPFSVVKVTEERTVIEKEKDETEKHEMNVNKEEEGVVVVAKTSESDKESEQTEEEYGIRTRSKTGVGKASATEACTTRSGKKRTTQARNRKRKVGDVDEASPPTKKKKKTEKHVSEEEEKDITTFEVFKSTSENASSDETTAERTEPPTLDDTPDEVKSADDDDKNKTSSPAENSSSFKVLRSYLMLSANDDSEVDVLSEDSNCSSGEYSDSGASAFVDLL